MAPVPTLPLASPPVAPAPLDPSELLSKHALAALFQVKPQSVMSWYRKGKLPPPIAIGRRIFWLRSEVADLIRRDRKAVAHATR